MTFTFSYKFLSFHLKLKTWKGLWFISSSLSFIFKKLHTYTTAVYFTHFWHFSCHLSSVLALLCYLRRLKGGFRIKHSHFLKHQENNFSSSSKVNTVKGHKIKLRENHHFCISVLVCYL